MPSLKAFFLLILMPISLWSLDPGAKAGFRFAVVGDGRGNDNGLNRAIADDLVAALIPEKPAVVLFSGDLVYGPKPFPEMVSYLSNWVQVFAKPLRENGIETLPVRGNHDLVKDKEGTPSDKAWNTVFAGPWTLPDNGPEGEKNLTYAKAIGPCLFLALDVYGSGQARSYVNTNWLKAALATNKAPFTFAFAHVPLYNLFGKSAHPDGFGWNGSTREQDKGARDALVAQLLDAGAGVYFCGHDHWLDIAVAKLGDGREFVQALSGGAGAPIRKWEEGTYRDTPVSNIMHADAFGYLLADIQGDRLTLTPKLHDGNRQFTNGVAFQKIVGQARVK